MQSEGDKRPEQTDGASVGISRAAPWPLENPGAKTYERGEFCVVSRDLAELPAMWTIIGTFDFSDS